MSRIDELLHEHSLHSIRSDGSQMIALETGQTEAGPEWEILFVRKEGRVEHDGTMILDTGEKAVLRKISTNERLQKIAALHDFVEWQPRVLEEHLDERVLTLQEQLQQKERVLGEMKVQYEETDQQLQKINALYEQAEKRVKELVVSQRRKERSSQRIDLEELEKRFQSTAAAIAERTPSETQKIIANSVALGAGFYEEVGAQSHESFRLSLWLAAAGGIIFLVTMIASVLITWFQGDSGFITVTGTIAATLTEGLAASNRLYNQASKQFANFQVDLDRINRSSICYAMITEDGFEKKAEKQQETIVKIIEALLK